MWERIEESLDIKGTVEYGIFQLETIPGTLLWRRHERKGKSRFSTLRNALFNEQGARNSCLGLAPYPKKQYSLTGRLVVPYVATWLAGSGVAFLVRSTAAVPEITLVHPDRLSNLAPNSAEELTEFLSRIFSESGARFGVRRLAQSCILAP